METNIQKPLNQQTLQQTVLAKQKTNSKTYNRRMALYKYPGYETGQGWTMKPGNLEGGFWGDK